MKNTDAVLNKLSILPRKMLGLHGIDNVAAFVLYELADPQCFHLAKAAYIIDNRDFNCSKGVVGMSQNDFAYDDADIWLDPQKFSDHMDASTFNKLVREYNDESYSVNNLSDQEVIERLADTLHIDDPRTYIWNMKHENRGFLVYEKADKEPCSCEYLLNGMCLLGFCPIY